jgi:hypothetical protein
MFLLRVLCVYALTVTASYAQSVWVDYQWSVAPAQEKRFVSAVSDFMSSETFEAFPGKILFNASVVNGDNPATHSFAVIYPSVEAMETNNANLVGNKDWNQFRASLDSAGDSVGETLYMHVAGFGPQDDDQRSWVGQVLQVRNPANYVRDLGSMMQTDTMKAVPGSIDIWQVVAGGVPGATHVAVFGYKSFTAGTNFLSSSAQNPEFVSGMMALGKSRTILGSLWTQTAAEFGPMSMADIR